jgi:hypothetical protein
MGGSARGGKMNKQLYLENVISDILLNVAYFYNENTQEMTTSDFQGYCQAEAKKIINLVELTQAGEIK